MTVLDSIPAWLSARPPEAAAAIATNSAVSTCAAELAAESTSSCLSPSSSSPPLDSPFATPHSPFPECEALADTFLAKIAAGTECLAAIAAFHHIPYPRFTLWLLQPSTQERLAALSTAIASAARLTAIAALPDIVRGLKTSVAQLQSQTHMTIAPQGANHLLAESIILRRHRALIAAASLIYRISRFTCPGQHPQPRPSTSPKGEVAAKRPVGAPAFSSAASTSSLRSPLRSLPRLDLPAIDFPDPDQRPATAASLPSRNPDHGTRNPTSFPTSDFPHPTSDIDPTAPAFPSAPSRFSSSPRSESRLPSVLSVDSVVQLQSAADEHLFPTSAERMPVDEALEAIINDFDLDDDQAEELRKDPPTWIRENLLAQNGLVEVKPRAKRRSRLRR